MPHCFVYSDPAALFSHCLSLQYKKDGYDVDINLIDVGGQLHERKFWVEHCELATGLIYVSALSGFNRVGEGGMSRFLESVQGTKLPSHRPPAAGKAAGGQ